MRLFKSSSILVLLALFFAAPDARTQTLAATPPMGWNSWDAYGLTINEVQFLDNLHALARFKKYGWSYAVIDEGWYLENPSAKQDAFQYSHDANGRLTPAVHRFPSAANQAGFQWLAGQAHKAGLKFGIHIIRGIPKQAVREDLPIANSSFRAGEAADTTDTCPWNPDNFGVRDNPAGQAYYDSIISLYASWGVDFLKVDCIADHPYKATEIRMIANAIRKSGRPIVLSLSPGPTSLSHAEEVARYAQMWRIADDIWDQWQFPAHPFPNGLLSAFDNLARWSQYAGPGHWPDADMLPWGALEPNPGYGQPRQSLLTQDEIRTQFTLWAIARTPLILGANLTRLDPFLTSLLKNREVIALNQSAASSREVPTADPSRLRIWTSAEKGSSSIYIALFNLENAPQAVTIPSALLPAGKKHTHIRDVWNHRTLPSGAHLSTTLPAHGCALFQLK